MAIRCCSPPESCAGKWSARWREADLGQQRAGGGEGVGLAGELQRQGDVLQRRHGGHEVERLEDDADIAAADQGELVLAQSHEVVTGDPHGARGGPLEAGDDHQQRSLARSAGADHRNRFARRDVDVDPLQYLYRPCAAGQRQRDVVQGDDWFGHDRKRLPPEGLPQALQVSTSVQLTKCHESGGKTSHAEGAIEGDARKHGVSTFSSAIGSSPRSPSGTTAAMAEQPVRIVVLGDSLVAGLGLKQSDAFPAQLERALKARGHAVEVINAGVSGDTTANGLARLAWAVPERTDAVILELGANDTLRGLDPGQAKANLEKIITALKGSGAEVLIAGMFAPRSLGKDYVRSFEGIYPELASKHGLILYPFFLDGVATDPKLNLDDGMHPNPRGVAEITKKILPSVEQLIERARVKHAATKG